MTDKMYRVSPGGLFHTHKVKYSPETERFIKDLIKESKLSIFQRRKVEESVKNGDPLPLPPTKTAHGLSQEMKQSLNQSHIKNIMPRRRKKEVIQQSGAYERERFTPTYEKANNEVEKKKLQEVMAFGRTLKSGKLRSSPHSLQFKDGDKEHPERKTAIDLIADDIADRQQFLARMESIGRGKEYREIINQEIQEKYLLANNLFKEMGKK